ncbi:MAG: NTP transferase domain-containing protein [Deltaproteobacteria bacterium]|nr:NTP transferase domain-containing protein [Deltaproteobacteria bacterium]
MRSGEETASLILAAGRGSRMKGFTGNKTLMPLLPDTSPYEGTHPILLQIVDSLPSGPKAVVVNHRKQDIIKATPGLGLTYCDQPRLNGTGGALLSARPFLEGLGSARLIITMGDVPFVKRETYMKLVDSLNEKSLVVLGFRPESKKQYGVLEIEGEEVRKIIEWEYWRKYPEERRKNLRVCNSGIYAARKDDLLRCLPVLASRPHRVEKWIHGKAIDVEEYFITDLVEYMVEEGLQVGYIIAEDENEVMGIDDLNALLRAQEIFRGPAKTCPA